MKGSTGTTTSTLPTGRRKRNNPLLPTGPVNPTVSEDILFPQKNSSSSLATSSSSSIRNKSLSSAPISTVSPRISTNTNSNQHNGKFSRNNDDNSNVTKSSTAEGIHHHRSISSVSSSHLALVPVHASSSSSSVSSSSTLPTSSHHHAIILANSNINRPPAFPRGYLVPHRPNFCKPLLELRSPTHGPTQAEVALQQRLHAAITELEYYGAPTYTEGKENWLRLRALEARVKLWRQRVARLQLTNHAVTSEQRIQLFARYRVERAVKRLLEAHRQKNPEEMIASVENGAPANYMFASTGETIFTTFILLKAAKFLVPLANLGADPHKPNADGYAPIILATLDNHLPSVKAVLDAGANVNYLHWFDESRRENASPLMIACARGFNAIITHLTTRKVFLQQRNAKGRTPLMFACRFRHLESVRLLLHERVDVDALDNSGFSASDWLRAAARERIIRQAQGAPLVDAHGMVTDAGNDSKALVALSTFTKFAKGDIDGNSSTSTSKVLHSLGQEINVSDAVGAIIGKVSLGVIETEIMNVLEAASNAIVRRQQDTARRLAEGIVGSTSLSRQGSSMNELARQLGQNSIKNGSVFQQVKDMMNAAGGAGGLINMISGPQERVTGRAARYGGHKKFNSKDEEEDDDDEDVYSDEEIDEENNENDGTNLNDENANAEPDGDDYVLASQPLKLKHRKDPLTLEIPAAMTSTKPKKKVRIRNDIIIPETKDWHYELYAHAQVRRDHLPKEATSEQLGRHVQKRPVAKIAFESTAPRQGRPLSAQIMDTATGDAFDWQLEGIDLVQKAAKKPGLEKKIDGVSLTPYAMIVATNPEQAARGMPGWTAIGNPVREHGDTQLDDVIQAAITPLSQAITVSRKRSMKPGDEIVKQQILFPMQAITAHFSSERQLQSAVQLYRQQQIERGLTSGDALEIARARAIRGQLEMQPIDDADLVGYQPLAEPCMVCNNRRANVRCLNCAQRQCEICCLSVHNQPGQRHHRVKPLLLRGMTEGALIAKQEARLHFVRMAAERAAVNAPYMDRVRRLMRRVRRRIAETKQRAAKEMEEKQRQAQFKDPTVPLLTNGENSSLAVFSAISSDIPTIDSLPSDSVVLGTSESVTQPIVPIALPSSVVPSIDPTDPDRALQPVPEVGRDLTTVHDTFIRSPKRGHYKRWVEGVIDKPGAKATKDSTFIRRHQNPRAEGRNENTTDDADNGPPPHVIAKLVGMFPKASAWMGIKAPDLFAPAPQGTGKPPQNNAMQRRLAERNKGIGSPTKTSENLGTTGSSTADVPAPITVDQPVERGDTVTVGVHPSVVPNESTLPSSPNFSPPVIETEGTPSLPSTENYTVTPKPVSLPSSVNPLPPIAESVPTITDDIHNVVQSFAQTSRALDEAIANASSALVKSPRRPVSQVSFRLDHDAKEDEENLRGKSRDYKTRQESRERQERKLSTPGSDEKKNEDDETELTASFPHSTFPFHSTTFAPVLQVDEEGKEGNDETPLTTPYMAVPFTDTPKTTDEHTFTSAARAFPFPKADTALSTPGTIESTNISPTILPSPKLPPPRPARRGSLLGTGGIHASAGGTIFEGIDDDIIEQAIREPLHMATGLHRTVHRHSITGKSGIANTLARRRGSMSSTGSGAPTEGLLSSTSTKDASVVSLPVMDTTGKAPPERRLSLHGGRLVVEAVPPAVTVTSTKEEQNLSVTESKRRSSYFRPSSTTNVDLPVTKPPLSRRSSFAMEVSTAVNEAAMTGVENYVRSRRQSLQSMPNGTLNYTGEISASIAIERQLQENRRLSSSSSSSSLPLVEDQRSPGSPTKDGTGSLSYGTRDFAANLASSPLPVVPEPTVTGDTRPDETSEDSNERHRQQKREEQEAKRQADKKHYEEIKQKAATSNETAIAATIDAIAHDVLFPMHPKSVSRRPSGSESIGTGSRRGSAVGTGLTADVATAVAVRRKSSVVLAAADILATAASTTGHAPPLEALVTSPSDHPDPSSANPLRPVTNQGSRRTSTVRQMFEVPNDGLGGFNRFVGDKELIQEADTALRNKNAEMKELRLTALREDILSLYVTMPELKLIHFYTENNQFEEAITLLDSTLLTQKTKIDLYRAQPLPASLSKRPSTTTSSKYSAISVPLLVAYARLRMKMHEYDTANHLIREAEQLCFEANLFIGDSWYESVQLVRCDWYIESRKNYEEAYRLISRYRQVLKTANTIALKSRFPDKISYVNHAHEEDILHAQACDEALVDVTKYMDKISSYLENVAMAKEDVRIEPPSYYRTEVKVPDDLRTQLTNVLDHEYRQRRGSVLLGDTLTANAQERIIGGTGSAVAQEVATQQERRRSSVTLGVIKGIAAEVIKEDAAERRDGIPEMDAPAKGPTSTTTELPKSRTYQMQVKPTLNELDTIVNEPRWVKMFHRYADTLGAADQVNFLIACQTLKGIAANDVAKRNVQYIWAKFMNNASTLTVIPVSTRVKIELKLQKEASVSSTATHIFDDAIVDVRDALVTSVLPRFLRSNRGKRYMEERSLSLGLPRWTLPQIAKLCEKDRRAQIMWIQGIVRGWLRKLRKLKAQGIPSRKEQYLAERARRKQQQQMNSTTVSTSGLTKTYGKDFRITRNDADDTTAQTSSRMMTTDDQSYGLASSVPTEIYQGGLPFDPAALYAGSEMGENSVHNMYGYGYNNDTGGTDPTLNDPNAMAGYAYDEPSGMYYHAQTGWYYDPLGRTYYGPNGEVMKNDDEMNEAPNGTVNNGTENTSNENHYNNSTDNQQNADTMNTVPYPDATTTAAYYAENTDLAGSVATNASYDPMRIYAQLGNGYDPVQALRLPTDGSLAGTMLTSGNNNHAAAEAEFGTAMSPEQAVKYSQYLARKHERSVWPPDKLREWAARAIQRVLRGHLTRKEVAAKLDVHYMPKLDASTGYYYYVDLRTGVSSWTLPKCLPPSLLTFKILCSTCETILANSYCIQCDEAHCSSCFAEFHTKGLRLQHVYCPVAIGDEVCIECEGRLGTRHCEQCDAMYCHSCYATIHNKNGREHHSWKETVVPEYGVDGHKLTVPEIDHAKIEIVKLKAQQHHLGHILQQQQQQMQYQTQAQENNTTGNFTAEPVGPQQYGGVQL